MDPKTYPVPQRPTTVTPPPSRGGPLGGNQTQQTQQRDTALSIVRGEINAIYRNNTTATQQTQPTATSTPQYAQASPQTPQGQAQQTNIPNAGQSQAMSDEWKKYHSAWQTYYQKYYEQYYVNEIRKNIATQKSQARQRLLGGTAADIASKETTSTSSDSPSAVLTQTEALQKIRQNIIDKAQQSAKKARRSRHFIPIAAALTVSFVALLLQYNQLLIANVKAYVSPSNTQAQNIIIDPNATIPVGPENKMIIPKINVDAPIVLNVGPTEQEQLAAMANGIAHVRYPGASALPGQIGNTVFSAHSSSDWSDSGAYKFIFVQLERLTKDDVIYINYQSKRYAYKVYETKTVAPTDVGSLYYTGNDPIITLITCTPLGTAQKRFLVFAKQISPDPQTAQKAEAPAEGTPPTSSQIPGTSPTLIERLFGAR